MVMFLKLQLWVKVRCLNSPRYGTGNKEVKASYKTFISCHSSDKERVEVDNSMSENIHNMYSTHMVFLFKIQSLLVKAPRKQMKWQRRRISTKSFRACGHHYDYVIGEELVQDNEMHNLIVLNISERYNHILRGYK